MCWGKSITVREVQHNLVKVPQRVEAAHTVEIVRRKQPVAWLVPAGMRMITGSVTDWDNHEARMASVWQQGVY